MEKNFKSDTPVDELREGLRLTIAFAKIKDQQDQEMIRDLAEKFYDPPACLDILEKMKNRVEARQRK